MVIFLGDWNAKVGSERHDSVVRQYALDELNDLRSILITFCEENDVQLYVLISEQLV